MRSYCKCKSEMIDYNFKSQTNFNYLLSYCPECGRAKIKLPNGAEQWLDNKMARNLVVDRIKVNKIIIKNFPAKDNSSFKAKVEIDILNKVKKEIDNIKN